MNIKLLPYNKFILDLPVSCKTALNRIDRHTHESSLGKSFNPLHKAFAGDISDTEFKIRRSVEYLNSFSPVVIGSVLSNNDHCAITIRMRMHYFVMAFMVVWLSGALIMTFGGFSFSISGTNAFISFCIGYWLMMRSFWKEAHQAKEELSIVLNEK